MVGDNVIVGDTDLVIEQVKERKNQLIRPKVSNIDQILICVSCAPPADLMLVDKLIISAKQNKIDAVLVITKNDILDEIFIEDIKNQYKDLGIKIISLSAKTEDNLKTLKTILKNKTSALAGQSGVGKSSLINAILNLNIKTNELIKKEIRGKNTTTASFLYKVDKNSFIIDTPGFCTMNLELKNAEDILMLYEDIYKYALGCKYKSCNHIDKTKDECGVMRALEEGKINKNRLDRLIKFYKTESGKRIIHTKGIKGGRKNV